MKPQPGKVTLELALSRIRLKLIAVFGLEQNLDSAASEKLV